MSDHFILITFLIYFANSNSLGQSTGCSSVVLNNGLLASSNNVTHSFTSLFTLIKPIPIRSRKGALGQDFSGKAK